MIKVQQQTYKSLLGIHGWSGVALGLLLYAVIFSGTLAVFADEISAWSNPSNLNETSGNSHQIMPDGIGRLVTELADSLNIDQPEILLFPSTTNRMRVLFHAHHGPAHDTAAQPSLPTAGPDALVVIDTSAMTVLQTIKGESEDLFKAVKSDALADFLVNFHVTLMLPGRWGLFLTGILGFAMMAAVVSGFIMHRHLIAELFTLRGKGAPILTARDRHVVASSWNLPFAFLLAFTGAFFSFGGAIGLPALAFVAFGGDEEVAQEMILSPINIEDPSPAPLTNLDAIIKTARQQKGAEPQTMQIRNYGRADAHIQISFPPEPNKLSAEIYNYSGSTGLFLGSQPLLGRQASAGGTVGSLMTPLHFGDFAGIASKAAWFALGSASAYVTFSGLLLWSRRRAAQPGWAWLGITTAAIGYGLPASLLVMAASYFIIVKNTAAFALHTSLLDIWLGSAAIIIIFCLALGKQRIELARQCLLLLCAALLCALPALRFFTTDINWLSSVAAPQMVIGGDILCLVTALTCLYFSRNTPAESAAEPITLSEPS